MMAALAASEEGALVTLLEKNNKLGRKVFITGKGRCNLTNASDVGELFDHVVSNSKFLYSAFYEFDNRQVMQLFEQWGCPLKIERGNRVFPVSDHSSDVIRALERALRERGVCVELKTAVSHLMLKADACGGVQPDRGRRYEADAVIVATGGLSYPATGSTGDGYRLAGECGHTVTALTPALVPMTVLEEDAGAMQGLSLKNISVSVWDGKKCLFEEFGELLFTHFGLSGPVILSASSRVGSLLSQKRLRLEIDLKPALSAEQLDRRFLREFEANSNRQLRNVLPSLYPMKMTGVIAARCQLPLDKRIYEMRREERKRLVDMTKHFSYEITGLRGMDEAIVTQGGICVKEINPSTMESKRVRNLYFAGEVLDLDALTGGYNLQIAWSTGHLAGVHAAGNGGNDEFFNCN